MPIEIKELSKGWKIAFIDCKEFPDLKHTVMTRFEITSPDGKNLFMGPSFTRNFIDDYFNIPGTGGSEQTERRTALIKDKEGLFKKWSLVRIEECIDKNSFDEHPQITFEKHSNWARKIEKGTLQPASKPQDSNTYIYTPERKIGFR